MLCLLKLLVNLRVLVSVPLLIVVTSMLTSIIPVSVTVLSAFMHSANLVSVDCNFPID